MQLSFQWCYTRPPERPGIRAVRWKRVEGYQLTSSLVLFYLASAITLGGALGVVAVRGVVHSALWLLVSVMGAAGLFLLAAAWPLALVQVLVYGGAVAAVILLAVNAPADDRSSGAPDTARWPVAAIVAMATFGVLAASVLFSGARGGARQVVDFDVLAETLIEDWWGPVVIVALVLAAALVGAAAIVRSGAARE